MHRCTYVRTCVSEQRHNIILESPETDICVFGRPPIASELTIEKKLTLVDSFGIWSRISKEKGEDSAWDFFSCCIFFCV